MAEVVKNLARVLWGKLMFNISYFAENDSLLSN